jgi:hypothetical protein
MAARAAALLGPSSPRLLLTPGRAPRVLGASMTGRNHLPGAIMLLIREIMYCKPGKVRPMVEKFLAMSKLGEQMGMPPMRVMTDFAAEQYWTLVAEMEVPDMQSFEQMMSSPGGSDEDMKKFEEIMKGYHDLVDHGKREIYRIEG